MAYMSSVRRYNVGLIVWMIVITGLTTYPWSQFTSHAHWNKINWIPFHLFPFLLDDIIGNILLFVPFGCLFILSRPPTQKKYVLLSAVVWSGLLSFGVEFLQVFIHTRFPSMTDVLSNVVGGGIGGLLGLYWMRSRTKHDSYGFFPTLPPE